MPALEPHCNRLNFRYRVCLQRGVPWHSVTIECGFTLKRVRDMIRTYNQTVVTLSFINQLKMYIKEHVKQYKNITSKITIKGIVCVLGVSAQFWPNIITKFSCIIFCAKILQYSHYTFCIRVSIIFSLKGSAHFGLKNHTRKINSLGFLQLYRL